MMSKKKLSPVEMGSKTVKIVRKPSQTADKFKYKAKWHNGSYRDVLKNKQELLQRLSHLMHLNEYKNGEFKLPNGNWDEKEMYIENKKAMKEILKPNFLG